MPLRGPQKQPPFRLRWHAIANPATPSADIMSSPDPLNEATAPPSSPPRRVTRSSRKKQQKRLPSVDVTASPRKQRFELEVGDTRSPQRLWVTVETGGEDGGDGDGIDDGRLARRKLFGDGSTAKSTPVAGRRRKSTKTTTTVVPLRDDAGDEAVKTPRPRGRPRKSNGTPMPAKKKAAVSTTTTTTPADSVTKRRGRAAADKDLGGEDEEQPPTTKRKRGRPPGRSRLKAEVEADATPRARPTKRSKLSSDDATGDQVAADGPDSDIWMATLSDEGGPAQPSVTSPSPQRSAHEGLKSGHTHAYDEPSVTDVALTSDDIAPRPDDTVAQGEDFSMIFMDSVPSMQGLLAGSVPATVPEQLGDETSLIINRTLEAFGARNVESAERESELQREDMVMETVDGTRSSSLKRRREDDEQDQRARAGDEASEAQEDSSVDMSRRFFAVETVAQPSEVVVHNDDVVEQREEIDDEQQQMDGLDDMAPAHAESSTSSTSRSETGRLPTPDDTPPKTDDQQARSSSGDEARPSVAEATAASGTTPQQQQQAEDPSRPDKTARPGLSAIVRAGRALQSITSSEPPSPEAKERQLASPFRNSSLGATSPAASAVRDEEPQDGTLVDGDDGEGEDDDGDDGDVAGWTAAESG
ncbi:hypothetical protein CDD80_4069 [Ophiocordyceps camponoti-rufipedis]|uniref:Uncharacterized protein n=1 Tax=Ophiocordyceps camponoti-rufipedis TaxID=2004952 RepID=A0A2C5Z164_9HYPO|nr:hypothetical protein CDD80_4069 [Ophiocordyceps camponoti-rufipedis]